MPKKQKKQLYPRPALNPHPSLSLSRSDTTADGSGGPDNRSVTDCLKSLRTDEARHLPIRPPPVATVHPSLRNLLDVPDTPQPRPRSGRRIPGPAAPPSWQLLAHRHAPQGAETEHPRTSRDAPQWLDYEQMPLPGAKWPVRGSLLHKVLRKMAAQWDWHLDRDNVYLALLPLHLREVLLTYVARYAADETLEKSSSTLHVLFPHRKESGAGCRAHDAFIEDATEVKRLDLGRALGTWLRRTASLKKELMRYNAAQGSLSTGLRTMPEGRSEGLMVLPESWEDVDSAQNECFIQHSVSPSLQQYPVVRFPGLLHLSLTISPSMASPASVANWSSLLSMTLHLSTLQSLALGYWPCPTLTPHAAAVSAKSSNPVSRTLPRIPYGGTDMYTESESSWQEAAGILRRLSRHLYCLRWLDLTGCGAWFAALTWTDTKLLDTSLVSEARPCETGPDWNGSWRNIEYLRLGVGWTPPGAEETVQSSIPRKSSFKDSSNSSLGRSTKAWAPDADSNVCGLIRQDWDVQQERGKYIAQKQVAELKVIQVRAHEVASVLRVLREKASGKWVEIGF